MAQPTADCNEIFERIPSVLSSRTRAVQTGKWLFSAKKPLGYVWECAKVVLCDGRLACVRVVSGSYRVIGNKLAKVLPKAQSSVS